MGDDSPTAVADEPAREDAPRRQKTKASLISSSDETLKGPRRQRTKLSFSSSEEQREIPRRQKTKYSLFSPSELTKEALRSRATGYPSVWTATANLNAALRGLGSARSLRGLLRGRDRTAGRARSWKHIQITDETLCRAVPVRAVLRAFGATLGSSEGNDDDYMLSTPQLRPDAFLSHNWAVPRAPKCLALAFYFNYNLALGLSFALQMIMFALSVAGKVPTLKQRSIGNHVERGPWCMIAGTSTFWLVMLFRYDLCPRVRWSKMRVFLDKMCIDQVDPVRRQRGIESIGAILARCEVMVVAFSGYYLSRLWTVFELCTFVATHDLTDLHVQPVYLAKMSTIGSAVVWAVLIGDNITDMLAMMDMRWHDFVQGLFLLMIFAACVACAKGLRKWGRERHEFQQQAECFRIETAECFDEADRHHVSVVVAAFARDAGLVDAGAEDSEAVAAFENHVKRIVPSALSKCLGRTGAPTRYAIVVLLPLLGWAMDNLASEIRHELLYEEMRSARLKQAVAMALMSAIQLTLCLIGLGAATWIAGQRTHAKGVAEAKWVGFITLVLLFPPALTIEFAKLMKILHRPSWRGVVMASVAFVLLTIIACCMNCRCLSASSDAAMASTKCEMESKPLGDVHLATDASPKRRADEISPEHEEPPDLEAENDIPANLAADKQQEHREECDFHLQGHGEVPSDPKSVEFGVAGELVASTNCLASTDHSQGVPDFSGKEARFEPPAVADVVITGEDRYSPEAHEEGLGQCQCRTFCGLTARAPACGRCVGSSRPTRLCSVPL